MDLRMPERGGTRGGAAQFSWDEVKGSKDRDYYLGHSVNASVGRWQKHKDLLWFTKGKDGASVTGGGALAEEERRSELARVKQAEADYMDAALTGRQATSLLSGAVSAADIKSAVDAAAAAAGEDGGEPAAMVKVESESGLGFGRTATQQRADGEAVETLQGNTSVALERERARQSEHSGSRKGFTDGGRDAEAAGESKEERRARRRLEKAARAERRERRRGSGRRSRSRSRSIDRRHRESTPPRRRQHEDGDARRRDADENDRRSSSRYEASPPPRGHRHEASPSHRRHRHERSPSPRRYRHKPSLLPSPRGHKTEPSSSPPPRRHRHDTPPRRR